ncbi:MAG: energy-coupling factor transporter transmembrane protein EcfT [Actinomycetia bacterium]|nr:energy-coupling factor transporter transmembrane protein EcfT [Actinomycetes bacterium]
MPPGETVTLARRNPEAALWALVGWSVAAFLARWPVLLGQAGMLGLLLVRSDVDRRLRTLRAGVRYLPWAAVWTVSSWWGYGFRPGELIPALTLGAATVLVVVAFELALGGLDVSGTVGLLTGGLARWRRWGVPVEEIGVVLASAVRFLPLLRAEWRHLYDTARLEDPPRGFGARLRLAAGCFVPLLVRGFWRADQMAMVLWLKGATRGTAVVPPRWTRRDVAVVVGVAAVVILAWGVGRWLWL